MTTTVPHFPRIETFDRPDGTIEVLTLGMSRVFDGPDARGDVLRHLQGLAAGREFNRAIRVVTHVDEVDTALIVTPEGTYYDETMPAAVHTIPTASEVPLTTAQPSDVDAAPTSLPESAPSSHVGLGILDPTTQTVPPTPATADDRPDPSSLPTLSTPARAAEVLAGPGIPRHARKSFIADGPAVEPARQGWRGALNRVGMRLDPGPVERAWRDDVALVSQHWPGPRTISIGNPKGSANKTPTTAMLGAVFARYGGAGVLAWDNNETRGSLAWRTQRANHEATVLDLLPQVSSLLSTGAQSAEMSYFAHHQPRDKYDVLRSDQSTEGDHEVSADDVAAIHRVAGRYYRMILMDSGNNERAANWRAMIERADVLVVPCTNVEDTAEAGARMLEALTARDEKSAKLAKNAVVIVSKRTPAKENNIPRIVEGFTPLVREVVTIPFDKALVSGVIHFDALRADTQRAWLRAAAAVARGL